MSNRDGKAEGTTSCAAPAELSWLADICGRYSLPSDSDRHALHEREILAAEPYRLDRNGEPWIVATDGKLAVLLRRPSDLKPLPEFALAKQFMDFVQFGERLRKFGETGITSLHVWASVRTCPTCKTHNVPLKLFPGIADDCQAVAPGVIGKAPIDKRRLMRALPNLPNQRVTLATRKEGVVICGDGLTIIVAPVRDELLDDPTADVFTDYKLIEKKRK